MGFQFIAVGTKSIGLNTIGTGVDVGGMNFFHQVGPGKIQLVITAVDKYSGGIQHGTDGAIEEKDSFF